LDNGAEKLLLEERQECGGPPASDEGTAAELGRRVAPASIMFDMLVRYKQGTGATTISDAVPVDGFGSGLSGRGPLATSERQTESGGARRYRRAAQHKEVLLGDIFDEAWYLADAKRVYRRE